MAVPVQKGMQVELGIGLYMYAGYVVEGADVEPTGKSKLLTDELDETVTRIDWDPGKKLKLEMYAKSGSDPETLKIGDTVTVNTVAYSVTAAPVKRAKGAEEVKVSLDLEMFDSLDLA